MNERMRVLVLTGRTDDIKLLRAELDPGSDIESIAIGNSVPAGPWDALVWDRQCAAARTDVARLLEQAGRPALILLADDDGRVVAQDAERAGCSDWVVRSHPWRLKSSVHRAQRTRLDASRRHRLDTQKLALLGQLTGGVAHDFNNILTVVSASADILRSRLDACDELQHHAVEIIRASNKAAALTRRLLTFGRDHDTRPGVLDLRTLVSEVEKMLRRVIGEGVTLATTAPEIPLRVRADAVRLEQVVMNLAINARDAMPSGGRLSIGTGRRELDAETTCLNLASGPYVTLEVTDEGEGMDAATRSHIFEPFFTTKKRKGGTGLGLSTVAGIVKEAGGAIEVTSTPGFGTTFRIWLPESCGPARPSKPRKATRSRTVATGRILLVEDDSSVRKALQRTLQAAGYDVVAASGGAEVRNLLGRDGPFQLDALICDVVMPGIAGPDLARRIRRHAPHLKVVMISGYPESLIKGTTHADAFLCKPFAPAKLVRTVRNLLEAGERSSSHARKQSGRDATDRETTIGAASPEPLERTEPES